MVALPGLKEIPEPLEAPHLREKRPSPGRQQAQPQGDACSVAPGRHPLAPAPPAGHHHQGQQKERGVGTDASGCGHERRQGEHEALIPLGQLEGTAADRHHPAQLNAVAQGLAGVIPKERGAEEQPHQPGPHPGAAKPFPQPPAAGQGAGGGEGIHQLQGPHPIPAHQGLDEAAQGDQTPEHPGHVGHMVGQIEAGEGQHEVAGVPGLHQLGAGGPTAQQPQKKEPHQPGGWAVAAQHHGWRSPPEAMASR